MVVQVANVAIHNHIPSNLKRLFASHGGTSGKRGNPQSYPIKPKAYFTGAGFTSQNNAFIRGIAFNCISAASLVYLLK